MADARLPDCPIVFANQRFFDLTQVGGFVSCLNLLKPHSIDNPGSTLAKKFLAVTADSCKGPTQTEMT